MMSTGMVGAISTWRGLGPFMAARIFSFFFNEPAPTEIYPLSLHAALPISADKPDFRRTIRPSLQVPQVLTPSCSGCRSEEHTSELPPLRHLVCRLLLEKRQHRSRHDVRLTGRGRAVAWRGPRGRV